MLARALGALTLVLVFTAGSASAQASAGGNEPVSRGRPLSEWVADLKGAAPPRRRPDRSRPGRR